METVKNIASAVIAIGGLGAFVSGTAAFASAISEAAKHP
jgi:hypothetical protein